MFILILFLIFIIVLIAIYDYQLRRSRVWRHLNKFPGEPAMPLIGNALQLGINPYDINKNLKRIWEKHGRKNFRVVFGTDPMLMLCEPADVKSILHSNVEIEKTEQQLCFFKEVFGDSLVHARGDRWRLMRKILTPVFHYNILEKYLTIANEESSILIEKLKGHVDGPAFNISPYILAHGLDIIASTTLGVKLNAQSGGEQAYISATQKIMPLFIKRWFSFWYRHDFVFKLSSLSREMTEIVKVMNETLDEIIQYRRVEFEKNVIPNIKSEEEILDYISNNRITLTFIDILFLLIKPDGESIPDSWIKEETNLIMFAGVDTTLSTVNFAITNLAKYKNLQNKVYEEQKAIFGADMREPTMQDLNEMKYLKRFVQESLRITPAVSQFGRNIKNDLILNDGKTIAAGTNLTIFLPGLHMNPDIFADPETFDPDRFLEHINPYTYVPFSAGPRNCIGMNFAWLEVRATLSKIIRNYELSLEGPHHEPIALNEVICTSMNGFYVKLKRRHMK